MSFTAMVATGWVRWRLLVVGENMFVSCCALPVSPGPGPSSVRPDVRGRVLIQIVASSRTNEHEERNTGIGFLFDFQAK